MRVPGVGPAKCRLMFVGEHVGSEELRQGQPFVGRTSVDFNARLNGYDLPHRDDVYLTNLVKEALRGKKVTQEEIDRDAPELEAEIAAVNPEIVVALGQVSARWFLGDVDLEYAHGLPWPWHGRLVYCAYHPAAGVHSPELGARHDYDMQRLGLLLKGRLPPHVQDTAGEDYIDATPDDVYALFAAGPLELGLDTEGWTHAPWSLQISDRPGTGLVCRTPAALAAFRECYLSACPRPRLIFHPALHELPMLSKLGVEVPDDGFTDTSLKAHLLGIEPLGAKPLFFRHAGMEQDSYTDITYEASERIARDWLLNIVMTWPRDPGAKPHWAEKQLRLIDRMIVKDDGVRTLRQRWADCRAREVLEDEEELIGPMPEATLDDVPLPKAIRYAGRDADGTLRINAPLDQQIEAMELQDALQADIGAVPILNRMQIVGMGVDVEFFRRLSAELQIEWNKEQALLDEIVGHPLNVNSTVAVPEYLFDQLGLPIRKYTDSGKGSTNDKVLEAIRLDPRTPIDAKVAIAQIQEVREIRKIKSSFADAIPEFVREGRIHPRFRIVSTGRLACSDPNLLAFPKHSTRGLRIREGFLAGTDRTLGSMDLCLVPGTRILTADLRWIPIESCCVGQRLVAIDEDAQAINERKQRQMRTCEVTHVSQNVQPCYRIYLEDGTTLTASRWHPWLAEQRQGELDGRLDWTLTEDLIVGDRLHRYLEPWETDTSWEAGYLAGIFDGEGSLDREDATLTFTQNPGAVLARVQHMLRQRGYDFHRHRPIVKKGGFAGSRSSHQIWMCGVADVMRFLGTLRPERLLQDVEKLWEGKAPRSHRLKKASPSFRSRRLRVVEMEFLGDMPTVGLQTTTRTFVAEGFFTHNSQIEMRVFAIDCGDARMRSQFQSGYDFHLIGAAEKLGKSLADVTKHERFMQKAVNFGILMGITEHGLLDQYHKAGLFAYTLDDLRRYLADWFKQYPAAGPYIQAKHAEARRYGYVRDMLGRLRYLPGIRSQDKYIRMEAERQAQATPTQSGAQGIMKRLMKKVWVRMRWVREHESWHWEPLLQIHDDLMTEFDAGKRSEVERHLSDAVADIQWWDIPITVGEPSAGPRWSDL